MKLKNQLALFKELSKSGIVTLVLISVFAGYLIGHSPERPFDFLRMVLTLLGILCLAAGSSALNQYQERALDAQMARTSKRPLPSGRVSTQVVLLFVSICLVIGLIILLSLDEILFYLGVGAVLSYNGLYTLWWKPKWAYAAIPGAIPGALPILMGHISASRYSVSPGGIYLFLILFFWQMPHFWALALKYKEDYAQGGFPTLPVSRGTGVTVHQIVIWCLAYICLSLLAPIFLGVGWIYTSLTLLMGLKLLWELYRFACAPKSQRWLHFFLWINFSLIIYLGAATIDLWSLHLPIQNFTR